MNIIDLIASDNYIIYNKQFAKKYSVESAILLGAMCGYQKGFNNEEFYREQSKIIEDTALSLYGLRNATKELQVIGVLEIKKKGLPAKHYYKINADKLAECLDILSTRPIVFDSTGDIESNSTINNNKNNNKINYNNIVDYLNLKAKTNYRSTTPKTQSLIRARLNEGFTEDDFKKVIDNKCKEWIGTEFEKFLRPETLFGNKFENYLNANIIERKKDITELKSARRREYTKEQLDDLFDDIENIQI